jgi:hypothetical protein
MPQDIESLLSGIFGSSAPRLKKRLLDLDQMPSTDARAGRMAGEARNYERTLGDTGQDVEAILRDIATSQPEALVKAFEEPGIGTATNAVAQTALLANQPAKALGAIGTGLGVSLADDTNLFGLFGEASADDVDPLGPDQRARLKVLQDKQAKGRTLSRAEREEQGTYLQTLQAAATAKAEGDARNKEAAGRAERQEYDEAVDYAGKVRDDALAKDFRFQDTELGKTWNEISGVAPFGAAFGAGALTRLGTGPGQSFAGKVVKDYALPIVSGTGAAFAAQNVPLFANMGAPANNPQKEAFLAYARELPQGHPRKQEMMDYAQRLPDENPVQSEAYDQFNEGLGKRLGVAALEGLTFGKLGASAVNVGGRAYRAATGQASGGGASGGTGGGNNPPNPNPPPPIPPPTNLATGPYKKLPQNVRGRVQDAYVGGRAVAGGTEMVPALGAPKIKQALEKLGYDVPVTEQRIKDTNIAVRQFIQKEGREPVSKADWSRIFTDKTLAVPLAVGGGAAAMSDPELEAMLAEIMGGGR